MSVHTVYPWQVQPGDRLLGRPGTIERVVQHTGFWHYSTADGAPIGACSHFTRIQVIRPTQPAGDQ